MDIFIIIIESIAVVALVTHMVSVFKQMMEEETDG